MLPKNHQELFREYISKSVSTIHEFSWRIDKDCQDLREWANDYAKSNNLECPTNPHHFGIYSEEE